MSEDSQSHGSRLRRIARQAMLERGLQPDFSSEAIVQLERISGPAREAGGTIRDLRNLPWASIDNDESLDLDQLTVCEALHDGSARVLVAVADVDAVVVKGTPLDVHAEQNTTSVYTAAEIFHMLPEKLSTDLTSLADRQERLATVIELAVDGNGRPAASDIYRAVVVNHAKLAYDSVATWLEGEAPCPEAAAQFKGMEGQIRLQDAVAGKMRLFRHEQGSLNLQTPEPRAILEADAVVDLRLEKLNRARHLIEEFMIGANIAAAQYLERRGVPSLRRVVRSPERWRRIVDVARGYGETLPVEPDARSLQEFLARRARADPLRFPDLSLVIVKLMGAGEYDVKLPGDSSPGHFGLAVRDYAHSTAPNRRFPDLVTQRLVKAVLADSASPYETSELKSLAVHCTEKESAAGKVERHVRKSAAALLLERHVGEQYDAVVTGAAQKGTWVRALHPPAEGRLVRGFAGLEVGQKIRVKLIETDVERGYIDFARA